MAHKSNKLNFVYMAGITSDLPQKIRRPSPDDFRRDNIAGSHGIFFFRNPSFANDFCNFVLLL